MKKRSSIINLLMILIALLPLAYLAIIWSSVPDKVALHFNYKMEPDRIGSKTELWTTVLILAGASILAYLILGNIQKLDPKRKNTLPSPVFKKLADGLLIFMTAINFLIIYSSSSGTNLMNNLLFPLLGLLLAFVGNYMNNIKPNYFAGFRLPWTLSDDNNWRETHHLASKIWFWGGLGLAIISLFLPFKLAMPLFITVVVIMSVIPAIYSYSLFKKNSMR
jgi:uncharacterized membrane protein